MTPPRETLHEETLHLLAHLPNWELSLEPEEVAQLKYAAQCVRDLQTLRESINATECVDGCDSVAHAEGCTTTDLASHLVNTQREVAALRAENARLAEQDDFRRNELEAVRLENLGVRAENRRLASAAKIVEAMERQVETLKNWQRTAERELVEAGNKAGISDAMEQEIRTARSCLVGCVHVCESCGNEDDCSDMDAVIFIDKALAAYERTKGGA